MSLLVNSAIAGQKVAINSLETNEHGYVPIVLYLWILKFESFI